MNSVQTTHGLVSGRSFGGIDAYLGIPYARAPFGEFRFRAPAAPEAWTVVREATSFGPTAPQKAYANEGGLPDVPEPIIPGEDILTVNVWTPQHRDRPLPVLVWIHGGGYTAGCSANPWYDGSAFARDGVVLVSLNYRLGAEGMLAVEGGDSNRSLRDWIAALEWVRDNAAAFGGDPERVTVLGQSAGGMAVSTLLVSPAAEGLFHRAIIASGITGHSTQSAESASGLASEFAAVLGVPATRAGLNRVSPDDVVSAQDELAGTVDLIGWLRAPGSGTMPWLPTVDGDLVVSPLFEGVAAGRGATVPVLTGTTLHEFRWMGIRAVPGPEGKVLGQRLADTLFRRPTEEFVVARAGAPAPTFRYEFQWESRADREGIGSGHSIDIPFFFDTLDAPYVEPYTGQAPPQHLATAMHRAFVDFAVSGQPGWPAYDTAAESVMVFDDEPHLQRGVRFDV